MTLIVKGSWTQIPQLPRVWCPLGINGAWLNYLAWCSLGNQHLDNAPAGFDHVEIESLVGGDGHYARYIQVRRQSPSWDDCEIIFGSNRCWFNCLLNQHLPANSVQEQTYQYEVAARYAGWYRRNIPFNLDWCEIWERPQRFVETFGLLIGQPLTYNSSAEQAITQYRDTCRFQPESQELVVYQRAVYDMATDQDITNGEARLQRAREIVYTTWYRI